MHFRNYPCRRNREVRKHVINSTFTVYGGCSVVLVLRRMKHEEGEAQGTALHQIRASARGDREVHIQITKTSTKPPAMPDGHPSIGSGSQLRICGIVTSKLWKPRRGRCKTCWSYVDSKNAFSKRFHYIYHYYG